MHWGSKSMDFTSIADVCISHANPYQTLKADMDILK
jgi:hypothetical protein